MKNYKIYIKTKKKKLKWSFFEKISGRKTIIIDENYNLLSKN